MTSVSPRLARYFDDYSAYHRTKGNQLSHIFGISFIILGLFGLTAGITLGSPQFGTEWLRLDVALIILVLSMSWYISLDWKLAAPFGLFLLGLYFLGRTLPEGLLWTLFISGWGLQYLGHLVYEKKSPAFYKNLAHLLIGPLWIFAKLLGIKDMPADLER